MLRALCLTTVLVAAFATVVPAQIGWGFGRADDFSCDERRNDRLETFCEIREATLAGTSTIDVDASPNGGIRLRGGDRGDVQVRSRVVAVAETEQAARELGAAVSVDTANGRIRADGPASRRREYWSVSFDVQVPRNANVTLDTVNGGISIFDFYGTARFEARNGGVSLSNVGGDVRGETVNGGVNVDLRGDRWDGAGLDVETRNGGVRMRLPANYSAQLETGTVNGGLSIDFPVTVQGRLPAGRNRHLSAALGSGGPTIRVVTTNGGVSITRR